MLDTVHTNVNVILASLELIVMYEYRIVPSHHVETVLYAKILHHQLFHLIPPKHIHVNVSKEHMVNIVKRLVLIKKLAQLIHASTVAHALMVQPASCVPVHRAMVTPNVRLKRAPVIRIPV